MSTKRDKNPIVFFVQKSWLLMVSAILFGALLAILNTWWAPKIAKNKEEKFNAQANLMLKEAGRFEPVADVQIEIDGEPQPVEIKKGLTGEGELVGWAFLAEGAGFQDRIQLVVAVSADFENIEGYSVLSSNETPGFGDKIALPNGYYQKQFVGIPTRELILQKSGNPEVIDENIVAISGATVSSQAVVDILNTYVGKVKDALQEKGLIP